jgi:DNA gyrase/topoisomerase IV subunit A
LAHVRVRTDRVVAIFSNLGKLYVIRALDVPATTGFGEPLGSLLNLVDGESVVAIAAPDPAERQPGPLAGGENEDGLDDAEGDPELSQGFLFEEPEEPALTPTPVHAEEPKGILITRGGQGFRFDYSILRESTKRMGRRLVNLKPDDEVVAVKPVDGDLVAIAVNSGSVLIFPVGQVPVLAGPGQGVRMIRLAAGGSVVTLETVNPDDKLRIKTKRGKERVFAVREIQQGKRDTKGKPPGVSGISGIVEMARRRADEGQSE